MDRVSRLLEEWLSPDHDVQLLRLGWYRPVHAKSAGAQEVRSLLTARKLMQAKLLDVECSIRGVLRGFGMKVARSAAAGSRHASVSWSMVTRFWRPRQDSNLWPSD